MKTFMLITKEEFTQVKMIKEIKKDIGSLFLLEEIGILANMG